MLKPGSDELSEISSLTGVDISGNNRLVPPFMDWMIVEAIPMYVEELLLLLTCYVEGTS